MPDVAMTVIDGPRAIAGRFIVTGAAVDSPLGTTMPAGDMQNGAAPVQVTLVSEAALPSSALADRALREWKQLAKVTTTRVVRIVDQGKLDDGKVYIASAVPQGKTLEQIVASEGQLSIERIKSIIAQVGEALTEAQKVGVIHRDVSPRNIHVEGDSVTVGEFGLAEAVTDKVFGSPAFLSPEQAEGKPVDQRSNIYSLGGVIYYMLVGKPPFEGTPESLLAQHVSGTPPHPSATRADVPPELDRIVMKALEKSGGRRHLTLRQLITEVEAVAITVAPTTVASLPAIPDDAATIEQSALPPAEAMAAKTMMGQALLGETPVFVTASASQQEKAQPKAVHNDVFATPATSAPTMMAEVPKPAPKAVQPVQPAAKPGAVQSPAKKGFRETAWFKKGELEEEMAKAQAAVASEDPLAPSGQTGQHEAVDVAAADITSQDSRRLSLKTGATQMMQAIKVGSGAQAQVPGERMDEAEMIAEIDHSSRSLTIFAVVAGIVVLGLVLYFSLRKTEPAPVVPAPKAASAAPTPPATAAAPATPPAPPAPMDPLSEADAALAKADYPVAVDALLRASRASADPAHLTTTATVVQHALTQAVTDAQKRKDIIGEAQAKMLLGKIAPLVPAPPAPAAPKAGKAPKHAKLATRHK